MAPQPDSHRCKMFLGVGPSTAPTIAVPLLHLCDSTAREPLAPRAIQIGIHRESSRCQLVGSERTLVKGVDCAILTAWRYIARSWFHSSS